MPIQEFDITNDNDERKARRIEYNVWITALRLDIKATFSRPEIHRN